MNNQTLATLAIAPIVLAMISGVVNAEEGVYTFLGLWIIVFGMWANIRLYKIK